MKIELCMGSSCHVRGAQPILESLKAALKESKLENKVTIVGSNCLGQCKSGGVNMKVDDEVVTGITSANFSEFFETHVKKPLSFL